MELLDAIKAIEDPLERLRKAGETVEKLDELRLSTIQQLDDPTVRAREVHSVIEGHQGSVNKFSATRRDSFEELVKQGMSITKIADAVGISRSRVSQLRSSGIKAERLFFGTGRVTVAIGSKPEQGRRDAAKKHMISGEASEAYNLISDTIRSLGLDVEQEIVPPNGLVNLNRESLVVLCSVRLLPFLAQVMAADSHLDFIEDEQGWHLKDHSTDTVYRSPRDSGESKDIGYVGRLPGPGGKTTFLYAAGIHAEGTLGAAKWLTDNASDLYKKLKLQRFSTLVESEFDGSGATTSVRQLTALYREAK